MAPRGNQPGRRDRRPLRQPGDWDATDLARWTTEASIAAERRFASAPALAAGEDNPILHVLVGRATRRGAPLDGGQSAYGALEPFLVDLLQGAPVAAADLASGAASFFALRRGDLTAPIGRAAWRDRLLLPLVVLINAAGAGGAWWFLNSRHAVAARAWLAETPARLANYAKSWSLLSATLASIGLALACWAVQRRAAAARRAFAANKAATSALVWTLLLARATGGNLAGAPLLGRRVRRVSLPAPSVAEFALLWLAMLASSLWWSASTWGGPRDPVLAALVVGWACAGLRLLELAAVWQLRPLSEDLLEAAGRALRRR